MENNEKPQKSTEFMLSILKPILDEWNSVIREAWFVEDDANKTGVVIREFNHRNGIHGILLNRIGGVCGAYDWCWSVYARSGQSVEVMIH